MVWGGTRVYGEYSRGYSCQTKDWFMGRCFFWVVAGRCRRFGAARTATVCTSLARVGRREKREPKLMIIGETRDTTAKVHRHVDRAAKRYRD